MKSFTHATVRPFPVLLAGQPHQFLERTALREGGQPVWYMNALNEGHGYRKKENSDLYQQATVLFLQEFLVGQ